MSDCGDEGKGAQEERTFQARGVQGTEFSEVLRQSEDSIVWLPGQSAFILSTSVSVL